MAPMVRERVEQLRAAIEQHKGLAAELRNAKEDERSNQESLQNLEKRLEERFMELAEGGSVPPDVPLEDENLIKALESKRRFYETRVKLWRGRVQDSNAEIQAQRIALWPVFQDACRDLYQRKMVIFEEAARTLRQAYIDLIAIKDVSNINEGLFPPAVIIGQLPSDKRDGPLLDCRKVTKRDLFGDIHDALQAQLAEISQLIECNIG
jgi:hypothetical protein